MMRAEVRSYFSIAFAQGSRNCEPPPELQAQRLGRSPGEAANIAGAWFAQRGEAHCAAVFFGSALAADPKSQDARYNLGLALLEDRQAERAAETLQELVHRAPGSLRARR